MSTDPVQMYVDYLSTDEVVASYHRVLDKLSTGKGVLTNKQRRLLQLLAWDLLLELDRRQGTLFVP